METRTMISNYSATVVKILNLSKHPNADRLQVTNIFGNTVIVGLDTKIGDVGLFFPLESQIGLEYAQANDLLRRKDENGKTIGGLFDENRRVRAQTLRGIKSMGFFMPIDSLGDLQASLPASVGTNEIFNKEWQEGEEIEKLGDIVISQKYVPKYSKTPGSGRKEGRKPRESRIIPDQFRFHFETAQLGKNIHRLFPTDIIAITWKLHGTSAIAARVLVKQPVTLAEKISQWILNLLFGYTIDNAGYDYVYASRRVVKNEFEEDKNHYYGHDLWTEVGKEHFGGKLHTGETVYYEIVGYTRDGSSIQKNFDYGCEPPLKSLNELYYKAKAVEIANSPDVKLELKLANKIFVYRITMTAPDGSVTELQWNQVKERCNELGVNYVPEIYYGEAEDLFPFLRREDHWNENFLDHLKTTYVHDQDSIFCENKVPEEGICVRKEGLNIEVFKLKSFRFLEHETKSLDKGEIDIETVESDGASS